MKPWSGTIRVVVGLILVPCLVVLSGCGYVWRAFDPVAVERRNVDTPVATRTDPDQVRAEAILFAHEVRDGRIVVTVTRRADLYDLRTDTVTRQVVEKWGYGKAKRRWPVAFDAVTGSLLFLGGGAALALAGTQPAEDEVEYRDNPDTGVRERRTVPNSSTRDYTYVAGGVGLGVSIPFLVSAIHNGVKTRDRKVGGPERLDLPTELDARTVATPLTGVPVDVRFPGGGGTSLATDAGGRVTLDLPDDPAQLLPLTYLVRITVPGRNAEYTVPADAAALALLPPTVWARADALAATVRETRGRYEQLRVAEVEQARVRRDAAQAAYDRNVGPLRNEYEALRPQPVLYQIDGKIKDWNDDAIQIWGRAWGPLGEGYAPEDTNVIVFEYDRAVAEQFGFTQYVGRHYYRGKSSGQGYFGQPVPVRVYGPEPPETGAALAAHRRLDVAEAKYGPPLARAKTAHDDAVAEKTPALIPARTEMERAAADYRENLPTDPYELKP